MSPIAGGIEPFSPCDGIIREYFSRAASYSAPNGVPAQSPVLVQLMYPSVTIFCSIVSANTPPPPGVGGDKTASIISSHVNLAIMPVEEEINDMTIFPMHVTIGR